MGAGVDLLAEIVVAKLGSGVQLPAQIQGTSLLVVARLAVFKRGHHTY